MEKTGEASLVKSEGVLSPVLEESARVRVRAETGFSPGSRCASCVREDKKKEAWPPT